MPIKKGAYSFDGQGSRRRLFPMPVEPLIDHPKLLNATPQVYGALMRLLLHYWASECEPLPEGRHELKIIGRMNDRMVDEHGPLIMGVFEDVRPALDHYYAVRVGRRGNLKDLSQRAAGLRIIKALKQEDRKIEAERRMGQGDMIPRKLRTDRPPPIIPKPSAKKRRTG